MKDGSGYLIYFRYSKVKEILRKRPSTAKQLIKKTKIPQTSLYRILEGLLMNNEIVMLKTKRPNKSRKKKLPHIFKLKRGTQK